MVSHRRVRQLAHPKFKCAQVAKLMKAHACVHAQSLSCVQLSATPGTVACQAPLPIGFPRQEYLLEWVTISSSRVSSQPRNQAHISCVSCINKQILYHCTTYESTPPPKSLLTIRWWRQGAWYPNYCRNPPTKVMGLMYLFPYILGRTVQFLPQISISILQKEPVPWKIKEYNKRTWGIFLLFFHYYGAIGEHPKTPLKSRLVNEDGDKYSQAVHISHYPDNIPGTFKKSSSRHTGKSSQSSLKVLLCKSEE